MGYDPDECPDGLMDKALSLEKQMGIAALSELAPVYGKSATQRPLTAIEEIAGGSGLVGKPDIPCNKDSDHQGVPWERAVTAAGELRQMLSNPDNIMENAVLCKLLGLRTSEVEQWSPVRRRDAAIAVPSSGNQLKYIPRKKHPIAKRFELARFIGDCILTGHTHGQWLTSTDLRTARQKYQRAFAAEFLCPIALLQEFLHNDYSEGAVEDAADHFQVSTVTVNSLLVNNGLIPSLYADISLPYAWGI